MAKMEGMKVVVNALVGALPRWNTLVTFNTFSFPSSSSWDSIVVSKWLSFTNYCRNLMCISSIFNVLTVCIIFWLIFAIIGVNTFMGKFQVSKIRFSQWERRLWEIISQECVNEEDGSRFNHEIIPNKTVCLNETGALWVNPRITFDNVPLAYLALFQIATFKVHIPFSTFLVGEDGISLASCSELQYLF